MLTDRSCSAKQLPHQLRVAPLSHEKVPWVKLKRVPGAAGPNGLPQEVRNIDHAEIVIGVPSNLLNWKVVFLKWYE